jgi:putative addiction module component (TIGR02574 family)
MLKEYENTTAQKSVLSDEQYNEMEKRLKNYKSGKSKGYTIEQVRQHVKKQLVK